MKLYDELAAWWPLVSAPGDYAEEAEFYRNALASAAEIEVRSVLELGSGGGNNASHMKRHFRLTLVDPSPGMLSVSRTLNPECEHIEGDMRTIRLGRRFDGVFVHDAVAYMTTEEDLRRAIATAHAHTRRGGAAVFAPDHVRETFRASTRHGGHDGDGRSVRYLEWTWDPDPEDGTYTVDFAVLLRDGRGGIRVEHDRHVLGLFPRDLWMGCLVEAGFEARVKQFAHSELEPQGIEIFLGRRPT